MFLITYQLKDKYYRENVDLKYFEDDFYNAVSDFPMMSVFDVSEDEFTVYIKTNDDDKKNRIVRAFGSHLAKNSELGKLVEHKTNSSTLFIAKETKKNRL